MSLPRLNIPSSGEHHATRPGTQSPSSSETKTGQGLPTSCTSLPGLLSPNGSTPDTSNSATLSSASSSLGLPPQTPSDWLWRCHGCNLVFRLACTSRCLDCGHRFCGTKAGRPSSSRRKRAGTCISAFDHDGWEAWGLWRRAAPIHCAKEDRDARAALFDAGQHDCTIHCDYPSQCRHTATSRRRTREREAHERAHATRSRDSQGELEALAFLARVRNEPVSPIAEEDQESSWFNMSSGSDVVVVECFEDASEGGDLGVRVVAPASDSPVFCMPVSPESPAGDMEDVFFGAPFDMGDGECKEVPLGERVVLGQVGPKEAGALDASTRKGVDDSEDEDSGEEEGEGGDLVELARARKAFMLGEEL